MNNNDNEQITQLSKEEFNKLCTQTLTDITGVSISNELDYDDPAMEFIHPDINNKKRTLVKKNTLHLLK